METNTPIRKTEKRNRPPLSCEPCRSRKSKCNRALPCDQCIKRNKISACHYAVNVRHGNEITTPKRSNVADRLKNLETLVSSFVAQDLVIQSRKQPGHDNTIEQRSEVSRASKDSNFTPQSIPSIHRATQCGEDEKGLDPEAPRIRQSHDGQVNYVDSSHWLSILEDIREVRDHISSPGDLAASETPGSSEPPRWDLEPETSQLLNPNHPLCLDDILASLPPQPVCDKLLAHYFTSRFLVLGIVHPFKFQKEYEKFWEAPTKAPILWVALLLAILSTATSLLRFANVHKPDDGSLPPVRPLQQRTAQCLALGGYATANAYALEAFFLHLQSRFLTDVDADSHVHLWFAGGTVIRLAIRMGYHRDPSKMPGITPFDGEMRRRVWLNIFQIDALLSFQMGFPSMIPTEYCDAEPPRNLEYSDFFEGITTLPPSRPLTHDTPVLYIIAKAGVMSVFKKIVAHTQSLASPTYDKTIALDLEARDVYSKLPDILQRRDVNRCFMDPSSRIIERCTIELLYLKSLVILHRRYVSYHHDRAVAPPQFETSRRACAEAALGILARQADLHQAALPGGRLHEDRWMLASLTVHDFLLAAMVLCLDLSVRLSDGGGGGGTGSSRCTGDDLDLASREFRALQTSLSVWTATRSLSPEARVAALALELMIRRVAEKNAGLGVVQNTATPVEAAPILDEELPYASLMSEMIDGGEAPNWNLLDQYFQHPNMDEPAPSGETWDTYTVFGTAEF